MRRITLAVGILATAVAITAFATAQPPQGREPEERGPGKGCRRHGPPGGHGHFGDMAPPNRPGRPPHPLMLLFDTDKNGTISSDEIKNAGKALVKMDANKDGKLSAEELPGPPRPPHHGGPRPPHGGRERGDGGSARPARPKFDGRSRQ